MIKQDLYRMIIIVSHFWLFLAVCVFFPISVGHSCPTETLTLQKTEFQCSNSKMFDQNCLVSFDLVTSPCSFHLSLSDYYLFAISFAE